MKNLLNLFACLSIAASCTVANAATITKAQAILLPTQHNTVNGTVTFIQFADGVKITVDVSGLKPGAHGFHIHEWGDCGAPDASTAGAHFNPFAHQHGSPDDAMHHAGDLGNIVADADGKVNVEILSKAMKLNGVNSIIGRSVIVHADPDDFHTQPSGNSGSRLACGVIGVISGFPEKNK